VKAILNLKKPNNIKELKRILGLVNYLSKFLPKLSDNTKILRELEKKDTQW